MYNSDGTIAKSTDPNAGGSPTDADRTIYTYWDSGDSGFVAGTQGLLKSVREPGGDCSTGSGRKLCTSYTYDAAGRVATKTNGKGDVTTMEYDTLDRTVAVYFGGTQTCGLLGKTNCIEYTYDAEGNLTRRAEKGGNTDFTYDRLNRQLTNEQPQQIDITMAYDGAGNLTGYGQSIGSRDDVVTYTYDGGNIVDTVTDSSGTIDINADEDDGDTYIEEYIFPGAQGIKIDLDVKDNGKTESATVLSNQGGSGATELYKIAYDYTDGSQDEDQMQSRTTSHAGTDLNGTIEYEYEYGRLAEATDSSTAGKDYEYDHDEIGNVTLEKAGTATTYYGYDRAGQLCWRGPNNGTQLADGCPSTPTSGTTLNQDAAGNNTNTSGATGETEYNNRDQVTELGNVTMGYRDLGNDIRYDADNTTFVNGTLGITGTKTGFNTVYWYTRMPDGSILNSRKVNGPTQNYFTEPHNGTVVALFSPTGTTTATYTYSPYGETFESGSAAPDNPFRYISGWQDTAGPEDYYKLGARYYDAHGHFTQPDPVQGSIANPSTMTAYNYAVGDPVNQSDPSGRCVWGLPCPDPITAGRKIADIGGKILDIKATIDAVRNRDWNKLAALYVGKLVGGGVAGLCLAAIGATLIGIPACGVAGIGASEGTTWLVEHGLDKATS